MPTVGGHGAQNLSRSRGVLGRVNVLQSSPTATASTAATNITLESMGLFLLTGAAVVSLMYLVATRA